MAEETFHVFLSHNSDNKPAVRELARALKGRGIRYWLDAEQLPPRTLWQEGLEQAIGSIKKVAVMFGANGESPQKNLEMRAYIKKFVEKDAEAVIPVFPPGATATPPAQAWSRPRH